MRGQHHKMCPNHPDNAGKESPRRDFTADVDEAVLETERSSPPLGPILPRLPSFEDDADQEEFSITLDKSSGIDLGIEVDHDSGKLLVKRVYGGLMGQWNATQPEINQVGPGDCITDVNGIRDDTHRIWQECDTHQVLHMTLARVLFPL